MGALYPGGYIGDEKSKGNWLKNWADKWESEIRVLSKTADKCLQESYTAAACVVQSEWIFLQRMTKDTGKAFAGL